MNTFALLVGLGPLLGWGLFPTVATKIGGRPINQLFGTSMGTLLFAIVVSISMQLDFPTGKDLWLSILSGVAWSIAQIITFRSFTLVGSSRAMPVTTAFQLLGASLWGVFALGNWPGVTARVIGFVGLAVIILGAYLTVWTEHKDVAAGSKLKQALIMLAFGEIGYWGYSAAPQATEIDGLHAFLPQAIGMMIMVTIFGLVDLKQSKINVFTDVISWKHILSGLFFAFAALTYLISAQPNMNGLATGFILSQTSVILATLGGIYWLGQYKTRKEMMVTVIGLLLILVAATVTAFL
ncbi:MAG: GRP family sugar transporter [Micrococcaceae bacterium]